MNDFPREQLIQIITAYGRALADDPRRLEALLKDLAGEYRREIRVLVGAAEERVPAELLASKDALPREVLVARLTQRLDENLGLSREAAVWAVESWALALGVASAADIAAMSTQRDLAAPVPVTTAQLPRRRPSPLLPRASALSRRCRPRKAAAAAF